MSANQATTAGINQPPPATPDKIKATYQVAGESVTLSGEIVRRHLTKGEGKVTDTDIMQFVCVCRYNQLNPFLNEAYLVKYGTAPAQMIVSKEALLKRADACENYDGIQSGVIIMRNNQIVEVEGCFYTPEDKLIGGWARVYRSDRKFPFVSKVRIEEYNKERLTWKDMPSTMISKVAQVQALRLAFPAQLGAMYTREESVVDISHEEISSKVKDEAEEFMKSEAEDYAGKAPDKEAGAPAQPGGEDSKQSAQRTLL